MAYVDWLLRCRKIATCNCPYGCPCEFNGLPVYEVGQGIDATEIVEGHFGDVRLDGLFEATLEPILNPVTGKAWRASIKLPDGWEFREAEVVSATAKSRQGIAFEYAERYGTLWETTYGPYGIVE
jgi:hypothetical protein